MSDLENFPENSKLPLAEIQKATRHVFLCIGPDCCDSSRHEALWDLLKAETRRLSVPALRTKAACLRICTDGPWMVVYPDGIWYGRLNAARLRRILHEHLERGRPVKEWVAATMPCLPRCREWP
jgi:(2Fe-2S) ferredoxin